MFARQGHIEFVATLRIALEVTLGALRHEFVIPVAVGRMGSWECDCDIWFVDVEAENVLHVEALQKWWSLAENRSAASVRIRDLKNRLP